MWIFSLSEILFSLKCYYNKALKEIKSASWYEGIFCGFLIWIKLRSIYSLKVEEHAQKTKIKINNLNL